MGCIKKFGLYHRSNGKLFVCFLRGTYDKIVSSTCLFTILGVVVSLWDSFPDSFGPGSLSCISLYSQCLHSGESINIMKELTVDNLGRAQQMSRSSPKSVLLSGCHITV